MLEPMHIQHEHNKPLTICYPKYPSDAVAYMAASLEVNYLFTYNMLKESYKTHSLGRTYRTQLHIAQIRQKP